MAVIGYPQRLTTLLTTLFQRGQRLLMRRFQARGSSSHIPSPAVLVYLLLLSGYTCCQVYFAIQPPGEMAIFAAGGRYLEIDELYVLPAYREQAVGTTLMQAVMTAARRQGTEHFSVYSSTKQWRSMTALYEQLGFQMWSVRMFH